MVEDELEDEIFDTSEVIELSSGSESETSIKINMSPTACAEFVEVDKLNNMQSQVIELLSSDSEAGTPVKKSKYKLALLENMPKKRKLWKSNCENTKTLFKQFVVEYYNGNRKLPIYMRHSHTYRFTIERLCNILMDPDINSDYVCQIQPTRVAHNVTFVVDCSYLANKKDLLVDDLGVWKSNGTRKTTFSSSISSGCVTIHVGQSGQYVMHRAWYTHGTSEDFRKLTVYIEDKSSKEFLNLALVAYTFTTGVEHEVLVRPHGNSCSGQPYQKTLPSTLKQLKDTVMIEAKPAKSIVSAISGDLVDAHSAGEMLRNQKQVYNSRQSMKVKQQHSSPSQVQQTDVLYYLMEQSRRCYGDIQFVRDVKAAPEPMCVLATDTQLDNLVRFCTDHTQFAVLCIDPTFGIGEFNVTPIVFQHPMLESHRYGSSPIFLGPLLVHQKKEFTSYNYFLSTLIGLRPKLNALKAYGSDGEETLVQALKANFPWAQQLRCFLHMRRNIKSKLSDLNITPTSSAVILSDLFGKSDGTNFEEGLVDAEDESSFFSYLTEMEVKWKQLEQVEEPKFYDWFQKYAASVFAEAMIKPKREAAGLGSPPAEFTTNACESGHAALKNHLPKPCSWQEFIESSLQFIKDQQHEEELALLNRGQYKFKEQYSYLALGEKWFQLNKSQKEAHLKKIKTTKLTDKMGSPESDHSASISKSILPSSSQSLSLSVDVEGFASQVKISDSTLRSIWHKAETLLKNTEAMVAAPGMENAWFVTSISKEMPHLIRVSKKGTVSCDKECEHYRSIGVCSHLVAVAEKQGILVDFTKSFIKKKGNQTANLGEFALTGMPPGRNRKGGVPPRKRKSKINSSLLQRTPLSLSQNDHSSDYTSDETGTSQLASNQQHLRPSHQQFNYLSPNYQQSPWQYQPNYGAPYYSPIAYQQYCPPSNYLPYPLSPSFCDPICETSSQIIGESNCSASDSSAGENPFYLKMINHMLKVCGGCRGSYPKKSDGSLLDPPYDMCVSHEENITLTDPVSKKPFKKKTKVHYHANQACIRMKYPAFRPDVHLIIPSSLSSTLRQEHWDYLQVHFGIQY